MQPKGLADEMTLASPDARLLEAARAELGADAHRLLSRSPLERAGCLFGHTWREGRGYRMCVKCGRLRER